MDAGRIDGGRGAGEPLNCSALCSRTRAGGTGGLAKELDEDHDLGLQDLRIERRQDVVHRAQRVPASGVRLVAVGRDEDDRRVLGALPLAHQRRSLETVETRHVDVEQDDGELLPQQVPEGLPARVRADDFLVKLREDRRERQQLVPAVVDSQDADRVSGPADHRSSHARRTDSIWSVSTGFAR
jgi:hypothetical protein